MVDMTVTSRKLSINFTFLIIISSISKLQVFIFTFNYQIREHEVTSETLRFYLYQVVLNGGASFRWSFCPHSAWRSIESTTILTTDPILEPFEKVENSA